MLPRKKFCVPHLSCPEPVSPSTLATCYPHASQIYKPGIRCGVGPHASSCPQVSGLSGARAHDLPLRGLVWARIHSPCSLMSHPAVGERAYSLLSKPQPSTEVGAHLHSQYPLKPWEQMPACPVRTGASGSLPSQIHTWPHQWLLLPSTISLPALEERRGGEKLLVRLCWVQLACLKALPVCLPASPLLRGPQP